MSLTDHVCAPSNGFPAVYDSIGPPSAFHDPSIAVPVGSPSSDAFGSNSGRVRRPGTTAGHQPQSFGRRPNGGRALQESRVIGRLMLLMNFDAHHAPIKRGRWGKAVPDRPRRHPNMPHPLTYNLTVRTDDHRRLEAAGYWLWQRSENALTVDLHQSFCASPNRKWV